MLRIEDGKLSKAKSKLRKAKKTLRELSKSIEADSYYLDLFSSFIDKVSKRLIILTRLSKSLSKELKSVEKPLSSKKRDALNLKHLGFNSYITDNISAEGVNWKWVKDIDAKYKEAFKPKKEDISPPAPPPKDTPRPKDVRLKAEDKFDIDGVKVVKHKEIEISPANLTAIITLAHKSPSKQYSVVINSKDVTTILRRTFIAEVRKYMKAHKIKDPDTLTDPIFIRPDDTVKTGSFRLVTSSIDMDDAAWKVISTHYRFKSLSRKTKEEASERASLGTFKMSKREIANLVKKHSLTPLEPLKQFGSQFKIFSVDLTSGLRISNRLDSFILDLMKIVGKADRSRAIQLVIYGGPSDDKKKMEKEISKLFKQLVYERDEAKTKIKVSCPEDWDRKRCMSAKMGGDDEKLLVSEAGTCEDIDTAKLTDGFPFLRQSRGGLTHDKAKDKPRLYIIISPGNYSSTTQLRRAIEKAHIARYY
jgi:hypothetical protein